MEIMDLKIHLIKNHLLLKVIIMKMIICPVEQLKAKYPEMSDGELFERFGERGDNGIMYNEKTRMGR